MDEDASEKTKVTVKKNPRSPPIPKEVNKFVLENYGPLYYNSKDSLDRFRILEQIEEELVQRGYHIKSNEVERRLKNMKSHYRRKKADVSLGNVSTVEWEYFEALDNIFSTCEADSPKGDPVILPIKRPSVPEIKTEDDIKPQDL